MGNDRQKTQTVIENVFAGAVKKLLATETGRIVARLFVQFDMTTGEIQVYDDRETLLEKNLIFDWAERSERNTNHAAVPYSLVRAALAALNTRKLFNNPLFMRPFEVLHVDDGFNEIAVIFAIDDVDYISEGRLMKNLEQDLQSFLKKLLDISHA